MTNLKGRSYPDQAQGSIRDDLRRLRELRRVPYRVVWYTCGEQGNWCRLDTVNLSQIDMKGVYIIWHGGTNPKVVRVGQGDIRDRLTQHKSDDSMLYYKRFGVLMVTWAEVPKRYRDGIEVYLENMCNPLSRQRTLPIADPIRVNYPWE